MMIGMLMMLMMMMEMMMVRQMMIMMRLPMLIMLMITMRVMMLKMMCWIDSPFVAQLTPTPLPVPDWSVTHRALKCSSHWPSHYYHFGTAPLDVHTSTTPCDQ